MPTLWVLGGSFAVPHLNNSNYIRMVANDLRLELASCALGGSSIPHMCIEQWPQIRDHIGSGDIVLVALTSPHRTFFLSDHPDISALSDIRTSSGLRIFSTNPGDISKEEKSAIVDYYMYLHRDHLNLSWLQSWFYELNYICAQRHAVAVVLDGTHSSDIGSTRDDRYGNTGDISSASLQSIIRGCGHLYSISQAEAVDKESHKWLEDRVDFRMNHLGIANHKVLADKILDSIKSGAPLDLTVGFNTRYIDKQYFKSVDWLRQHTMWPPYCDIEGVWP